MLAAQDWLKGNPVHIGKSDYVVEDTCWIRISKTLIERPSYLQGPVEDCMMALGQLFWQQALVPSSRTALLRELRLRMNSHSEVNRAKSPES